MTGTPSNPINILHLTDFHYSTRSRHDQLVVRDALIGDLEKLKDGLLKPDLVVFSGDLVNSADEDDVYLRFYDDLLSPLLNAAGCSEARLVITSGNHDIQQSVVEKDKAFYQDLAKQLSDRSALNDAYSDISIRDAVSRKFAAFNDLKSGLGTPKPSSESVFSSTYTFPEIKLAVLELNSAWAGMAHVDKISDDRKLLIPERAILEGLRNFPADSHVAIVTHHPSAWLTEDSETDYLRSIDGRVEMTLFGHMHESRPQQIGAFKGACMFVQGGALYSGRKRYNGYSLVRFSTELRHTQLRLRSYFDKRKEFDSALDIAEDGVFHSTPEAKRFFYQSAQTVNRQHLRKWANDYADHLVRKYDEGLTDRKLCELFVAPPLYKNVVNTENEDEDVSEVAITFDEILESTANFVIVGKPEFGKTTLLQQLAVRQAKHSQLDTTEHPLIPALIDYSQIKPGDDRLHVQIGLGLGELPDSCRVGQLLSEGLILLLVDDVDAADTHRYSELQSFIRRHTKIRYIFSSPSRRNDSIVEPHDKSTPVAFERAFIRPLRRRDMRTLVDKWDPENRRNHDEILDRLSNEINNINVPFTPANGTILLSIFESHSNFRPINRTVLIEQFVEVLLDKHSLKQIERRQFDYANQVNYLSYIADKMARSNTYALERQALLDLTFEYLDDIGLKQRSETIVDEFISARIFGCREDGKIIFRYRAFLEFFVAKRMQDDANFASWVMEEDRYLSFFNEIQYFAGLKRSNADLLQILSSRFAALRSQLFQKIEMTPDPKVIDQFKLPNVNDSSDQIHASVENQIDMPVFTKEERDEILEADIPQDVEGRQEVFRPQTADLAAKWYTCLLLYANVVRNLEHVNDKLKRQSLSDILNAFSELIVASFGAVPNLAKHRVLRVNGVEYKVIAPKSMTEASLARMIYCQFPGVVGRMVWGALGTEKLERQIVEVDAISSAEAKLTQLLRQGLSLDLKLDGWPDRLEAFLQSLRHNSYLLEAAVWKANEAHKLATMSDHNRGQLRKIMAESVGILRGESPQQRKRIFDRQIEHYRKADLIRTLQAKADR